MRRSTIITAVVLSLLALTSTSFAGNKSNNDNKSHKKTWNFQQFVQQGANPDFYSFKKHKKHHNHGSHSNQNDNANNQPPVQQPFQPTTPGVNKQDDGVIRLPEGPPARPGYVWMGDHWERARATSSPTSGGPPPVANGGGGVTVTPANSGGPPPVANGGGGVTVTPAISVGPVIRDHRTGIVTVTPVPIPPQFGGQFDNPPPVVLNPVTTQPSPGRGAGGGRYEQNRANGGVTVSAVPGSQRPNDVTGVGGSPIDTAVESVLSVFGGGSITPAGSPGRRR